MKKAKHAEDRPMEILEYLDRRSKNAGDLEAKTASFMEAKWVEVAGCTLTGTDDDDELVRKLKNMVKQQAMA